MRNLHRTRFAGRTAHKAILLLLVSALFLTCVSPAAAQKEKKKKTDAAPSTDGSKMLIPLSDEQQIDYTLSEIVGAADSRVDQLSCGLPATARAHAAGAHGSLKYLHQGERYGGLGVLPVGLRSSCGWPTDGIPGPDYDGIREAQQPLGYRAQSHFARAEGPASRS